MRRKKLICVCCENQIEEKEVLYGDPDTHYEGKPLCESCYYEDEPVASVFSGEDEFPQEITHTRNETEGEFKVSWPQVEKYQAIEIILSVS